VYEILLERNAERDLKKLPKEIFDRDPKPPGTRKIIGSRNDWRIKVGDYRVIYEIDEEGRAIKIMRIRHRKQAYR
jgi:mRNA interferase RelE/StbE